MFENTDETTNNTAGTNPARFDTMFDYHERWLSFGEALTSFSVAASRYQALNASTWWSSMMTYGSRHMDDAWRDPVSFVNNALAEINTTMLELQHSDEFMKVQKELVRALGQLGGSHRDVSEIWQTWNHVPTRQDLDDVTRTVYELRREVRRLKRQLPAESRKHQGTDPGNKTAREVTLQ